MQRITNKGTPGPGPGAQGTDLTKSGQNLTLSHIVINSHTKSHRHYQNQNQEKLTPNDDSRNDKSGIDCSYKKGASEDLRENGQSQW